MQAHAGAQCCWQVYVCQGFQQLAVLRMHWNILQALHELWVDCVGHAFCFVLAEIDVLGTPRVFRSARTLGAAAPPLPPFMAPPCPRPSYCPGDTSFLIF